MYTFADLTTGETLLAAKQRADLLRQALLALDDLELMVIIVRANGATLREAGVHAGCSHVAVMRAQKRAMLKLRSWFKAHGILEVTDLF
jgi:DNA-directed RNA polymerase specialized sigma24 family protein